MKIVETGLWDIEQGTRVHQTSTAQDVNYSLVYLRHHKPTTYRII